MPVRTAERIFKSTIAELNEQHGRTLLQTELLQRERNPPNLFARLLSRLKRTPKPAPRIAYRTEQVNGRNMFVFRITRPNDELHQELRAIAYSAAENASNTTKTPVRPGLDIEASAAQGSPELQIVFIQGSASSITPTPRRKPN